MEENFINFSDWLKIDLRVGKIIEINEIDGADKLYKLVVDIGEEKRTIIAGLKPYFKPEELQGRLCIVFLNLKPRILKGIKSNGMILAAVDEKQDKVVLVSPEKDIELGSKIR